MLDSDDVPATGSDGTDTTDTTSTDTAGSSGADAPPPRKRAPRKRAAAAPAATPDVPAATETPEPSAEPAAAPRKRATRSRRTAAATEPAPDPVTVPAAEPVSEAAPDAAAAETAPPRTPRKRAAKKAAAAPEQPAETAAAAESALPAETEPAPAPAKRTRKRAAAAPAAPAPTDDTVTAEAGTTDPAAGPQPAAAVLFQAPAPVEPAPRRRRAATRAAGPAAGEPIDATDAPEPAPAGGDLTEVEDAEDRTAEPEDVREAAIEQASGARRRRRRGRRGRGGGGREIDGDDTTGESDDGEPGASADGGTGSADASGTSAEAADDESTDDSTDESTDGSGSGTRRRRRRRRSGASGDAEGDDPPNTTTHVREGRAKGADDGVRAVRGSTRLEAKRQRRRDGRETTRRRAPILTEAEFLARRESVERVMAVRQNGDRTQIAVLEDGVLVEHYVTRASATSYVGNVYLGRVQNVLPSMEAAFVDIGKGRNGVLYAGEVNWDAAGLEGKARTIEQALKSGDAVLVQVTKDPIGHKGARLTSQVSLPGRFLVYVPGGGMTGISRRLPDTERHRLKAILKKIVPDEAGVIVRTAAEGASEEDLAHDVERLKAQWDAIQKKAAQPKSAPTLVHGEPDLAIRVVRDVFNEDFARLVVQGEDAWNTVSQYVGDVAPDLAERVSKHVGNDDVFHALRVDEQLMKALDRKVWLPSGGSLVIDRTEAMTVIDVNTGKFVGAGGNLEQTVTRNNLEAAEEIVRQLRLRDVGGIVVIDFIDMVLESNRDLVLRRLTECLGRDRTKHQVAEVTSLGLVQMTRKRVGEGLLEAFSEPCEVCHGRGVLVHTEPVDKSGTPETADEKPKSRRKRGRKGGEDEAEPVEAPNATPEQRHAASAAIAAIHRAAAGSDSDAVPGSVDELASGLVAAAMQAGTGDTTRDTTREDARGAKRSRRTAQPTAAAVEAVAGLETAPPAPDSAAPDSATPDSAPAGNGAAPSGRRRRRAASRPAGPPVVATGP